MFLCFYEDIFLNNVIAALLPRLRATVVFTCLQVNIGIGPYNKHGGFLSHLSSGSTSILIHTFIVNWYINLDADTAQ